MDTVSVRPSEVPSYLRDSDFFKSLNIESDEEFDVPKVLMKMDARVTSEASLRHMLSTLQFWGSNSIPTTVFDYLTIFIIDKPPAWLSEYEEQFPVLTIVKEVCESAPKHQLAIAAKSKSTEFFSYMITQCGNAVSSRVLTEASAHGNFANLTLAYDIITKNRPNAMEQIYCNQAAANGHLECMRFLHDHGCPVDNKTCTAAAKGGHLECLKYAHENGFPWDSGTIRAAIGGGHLHCAVYANDNGCPWPKKCHLLAAETGNMECLQYTMQRTVENTSQVATAACRGGSLECLQYIVERNFRLSAGAYAAAVEVGSLDCVRFLHERCCEVDKAAFRGAMAGEHWECLRHLLTHESQRAGCAMEMALKYDRVEGIRMCLEFGLAVPAAASTRTALRSNSVQCLQYLHDNDLLQWGDALMEPAFMRANSAALQFAIEHGCPLTTPVTTAAARNGALQLLARLHELKCPWDETACAAAAKADSIECLRYLHEQGCPWDAQTCVEAAVGCMYTFSTMSCEKNEKCFRYAVEEGCPMSVEVARIFVRCSTTRLLRYAREHGCPWDETVSTAAQRRDDALEYCVEHGCPITAETMRIYNETHDVVAPVHNWVEF